MFRHLLLTFILITSLSCVRELDRKVPNHPLAVYWSNEVRKFAHLIQQNDADADTYFHLGRAYDGLKLWNEAERSYTTSIDIEPENSAGAHYHLGVVLIKQQRWRRAKAALKQSLRFQPGLDPRLRDRAQYYLGLTMLKLHENKQALAQLPHLDHNKALAYRLKQLILRKSRQIDR